MKKSAHLVVLSVFVLAAMAFSAIGAMAMAPASAAASSKNEVVGVIIAMDATSVTINGTVYNLITATEVQGTFQVGDMVRLEFFTNPDGSLTAYEVSKPESSGATVEPTGTETEVSTEPVSTEDSFGTPEPTSTMESVSTEPVGTEPVSTASASPDQHSGSGSGFNGSSQGSNSGNQNPNSGGSGNSNGD